MDEELSLDRLRAVDVVTMTAGLLAEKAAGCLARDESRDTDGARLCIDALRAVVEAAGDRLDTEQSRRMRTMVTELQLMFVKSGPKTADQD